MRYPGPNVPAIVKYLAKARVDPTNALLDIGERYGGVAHVRIGRRHAFLISSVDGAEHVLHANHHNYRGFQRSYERLRPLLGNGLLTSDGEVWRRHRRLVQRAFHQNQLEILSVDMVGAAQRFLATWENQDAPADVLDIGAEMALITLSIVTTSLFGKEIGERAAIVRDAFPRVLRHMVGRIFNPFMLPEWLPTRQNRSYENALASLNSIVHAMIADHRRHPGNSASLLGMLIAAHDGSADIQLDDAEVRDEVMTLLLAGYETCANALTWTLYLLALHPDIQERLAEEVCGVLLDRAPTYESMHLLPYTAMVFDEVLRLYPSAWVLAKEAIYDDVIDGWPIPAGSLIIVSPYVSHRLTAHWQAPQDFDPERFSAARTKNRPRFAYFPFGAGQRQCVGKSFALMEASLVLPLLVQRYRFLLHTGNSHDDDTPALTIPDVAMRPRTPILLKLERR